MFSKIQRPPRLHPGDPVKVIAPSGPIPRDRFDEGMAALGSRYRFQYDPNRLYEVEEGFLAGTDEARLQELNAAITDPKCRAIFMARGGYGIARLLPFVDRQALQRDPKPLLGFSDGTGLLATWVQAGVASIHGPVITQMGRLPVDDREAVTRLLEDPTPGVLLSGLEDLVPGRVAGPLVGGNLEVFSRLLGTPFLPELDGAILFLEEVGERPYRVDRLLTHLDLAGVFSRIAAVVIGELTNCDEPADGIEGSPTGREVVLERLSRLAIPVVCSEQFGHGSRNVPLPYGVMVELDTRHGILHSLEGLVT
ncbi:MAG: LD-carboxypeptidase [Deltaproteobacteria bacterium]|nr:LD-carboxypeptidase [Deltaproteobacteria bacterium]